MPEQTRVFRDYYEVTDDDLNGLQADLQDADDHIVSDTLEAGNAYWGFPVTRTTSTDVKVGNGRLYYGGKRYFNDTPGGVTLPLIGLRPQLQSRMIAIVAVPKDQQSDLEERDFETDATTQTFEPRNVAMLQQRWADLQAVAGPELVSPTPPVVPTTAVVIAYVTMTTAGITTVAMETANQVSNLAKVDERVVVLEGEFADVSSRTKTIADDIAKLAAQYGSLAGLAAIYTLAQDVARLKAKSNLPAAYVNYREDDFVDLSDTDTSYGGYAAKITQGMRFAPDAIGQQQLALFNPADPLVGPVTANAANKLSGNGLLLPAYSQQIFRIVKGNAGTMSLNQYTFQNYGLVQATMSRLRVRYGAEFEQAAGSAFFSGGTFSNPLQLGSNQAVASTFSKNGETFQVYDTGQVNPDGQEIYRLANFWQDSVTASYWQRLTAIGQATGFAWCQTFVQNQSGWCTGICPKISQKPTSGTIIVGLCGVVNGQPDLTNVLARVTLNAADVVAQAALGQWIVPIEPTFLAAGGRYGYFLITGDSFSVYVSDITANAGGTCFYALDGGVFYPNPSQNIQFDLAFASFQQNRVSVLLNSTSLSGGIAALDILADAVVPSNTSLVYEIQPQGSTGWTALAEADVSVLLNLPPLVSLRVTMTGTPNLMPGLRLSGSVATFSRPKTVLKHGTLPHTLAAPSSKISVKTTLIDFQPAHHSFTAKVLPAGGALRVPDTTTDVQVDARTIERTQVFNLPSATAAYVVESSGTTDNAANLFHPASRFEYAA